MIFWILLTLLSIAIVAPIVWPLLRQAPINGLSDADSRLAVQRDRRREIDDEEAAGRLTPELAGQARNDLVETLAAELRTAEVVASPGNGAHTPQRTIVAVLIATLVPLGAIGIYRTVGAPDIETLLATKSADRPVTEEDIRGMVDDLVKRTAAEPENGEAWLMLAQAWRALQDPEKAAQAYERAAAVLPPNARLLADQAEMLALSRGRDFGAEPRALLQKALRIDADDAKANALMAAVELQAGNRQEALPFLRIVLSGLQPGSEQAGQINELIENIGGPGAAGGPTISAAAEPVKAGARELAGVVSLDGDDPANGAVLFISARAPDGPRMPYAALRIEHPTWPLQFSLTDANAMSPQRTLSGAGDVVIEARLSVSGTAIRQSGDRYGQTAPIAPGDPAGRDLKIVIDRSVP